MKLLTKLTLDDKPFRNKFGMFYDNKTMAEKCLGVAGYCHPLPDNMSLYYYALAGQGKLVIEVYEKEEG